MQHQLKDLITNVLEEYQTSEVILKYYYLTYGY